jgi:hypothetical protein
MARVGEGRRQHQSTTGKCDNLNQAARRQYVVTCPDAAEAKLAALTRKPPDVANAA